MGVAAKAESYVSTVEHLEALCRVARELGAPDNARINHSSLTLCLEWPADREWQQTR